MCVRLCVYMYVYVYLYTHTQIHTYTHTQMCACVRACSGPVPLLYPTSIHCTLYIYIYVNSSYHTTHTKKAERRAPELPPGYLSSRHTPAPTAPARGQSTNGCIEREDPAAASIRRFFSLSFCCFFCCFLGNPS